MNSILYLIIAIIHRKIMTNYQDFTIQTLEQQNNRTRLRGRALLMPFKIKKKTFISMNTYSKSGHWTQKQTLKFCIFVDFHRQLFRKEAKKQYKLFKYMAEFIKTRSPTQCRSHHQKIGQYQTIPQLVNDCIKLIGKQTYQKNFLIYYYELENLNIEADTLEYSLHQQAVISNQQILEQNTEVKNSFCQEKQQNNVQTTDIYKQYPIKKTQENGHQNQQFGSLIPYLYPNHHSFFYGKNLDPYLHLPYLCHDFSKDMGSYSQAIYHYYETCKLINQQITKKNKAND